MFHRKRLGFFSGVQTTCDMDARSVVIFREIIPSTLSGNGYRYRDGILATAFDVTGSSGGCSCKVGGIGANFILESKLSQSSHREAEV